MSSDRGFQPIKRPLRDEDSLLEALAARKGVGRLQGPRQAPSAAAGAPEGPPSHEAQEPSGTAPATTAQMEKQVATPRSRMKAMNLELPAYVMQQLKERALREDCSVRHVIMRCLAAQGVTIHEPDLVADGRRIRGKVRV